MSSEIVPTLQAIQQLVEHGPDYHYEAFKECPLLPPPCPPPLCTPVDRTPRSYARELEAKWNGVGIPSPTSGSYASGVRTAVFGILETILGYQYGDTTSKAWADTVANVLLKTQVNALGYYASGDLNGIALRPVTSGLWFVGWDAYEQAVPRTYLDWLIDWAGMDPEYSGMIPGNMETTEITLQFFIRYLALAYP